MGSPFDNSVTVINRCPYATNTTEIPTTTSTTSTSSSTTESLTSTSTSTGVFQQETTGIETFDSSSYHIGSSTFLIFFSIFFLCK